MGPGKLAHLKSNQNWSFEIYFSWTT